VTIQGAAASCAEGFAGRGWVARQVADWLVSETERFLVITGEPGSGKIALAAWLAGLDPTSELSDVEDIVASGLLDGWPWDLVTGQSD
jgi:ABC-type molybdenum transport system ATPase subunit/photorepair protein PhrA